MRLVTWRRDSRAHNEHDAVRGVTQHEGRGEGIMRRAEGCDNAPPARDPEEPRVAPG